MPGAPGTGWNLIFDDEFTGSSIDTSNWTIGRAWNGADGSRGKGLAYMILGNRLSLIGREGDQ